MTSKKRITMKLKCPNPLFEQWLTEWRDKAIETDSKMQYCFGKALQSLRKYPLLLESGRDCRLLQGFGEKLCIMLDRKLQEYKANPVSNENCNNSINIGNIQNVSGNLNTSKRQKEYVPAWRSGPYAILVTLYKKSVEPEYPGFMSKSDLIKHGQHLCDKSFVKPDAGSYYTAWSSMKTLLEKNLVNKRGNPAKFSLTTQGGVLAQKLYENHMQDDSGNLTNVIDLDNDDDSNNKSKKKLKTNAASIYKNTNDKSDKPLPSSSSSLNSEDDKSLSTKSSQQSCSSSTSSQDEIFIFTPHSFEIILLVDKQEIAGTIKHNQEDTVLAELTYLNVPYESRHLKVGDYTWICRQRSSNKELVLPYIVERKRMDDLGCSIKDGRFHEQKFRLKQSGIQNVIYLIESFGSNTHTGLPLATLYQAASNTLIQDGFSVKFTDNLRGTAEYLASLTTILENNFKQKTLVSCPKHNLEPCTIKDDLVSLMPFQEFNKSASKSRNFKVREMFVRHLLQLKGMSVDKALAIVEKYPTPALLREAYNNNSLDNGEKLLANLVHGKLKKKIGPVVSKAIHQLYTSKKL